MARYAPYPGIPFPLGGTHFVGISGVGPDAAEYAGNDPAHVTQLGVFGYDRITPLAEIQKNRGLSNTMVMAQVPYNGPGGVTPWMAGGGSTVRGVPEKDSVKPFVSTTHDGKPGTYALMADGSVRFVAADVKDEVFKAMATIKGPAPEFFDLDRDAPAIKGPKSLAVKDVAAVTVPKAKPLPAAGGDSGGWQDIGSKELNFSVKMPAAPQVTKLPMPGVGVATMYMAPLASKNLMFMVQAAEVPPAAFAQGPDETLKTFQAGMLAVMKGATVKKESPVSLGKHPGKQFEIDTGGKGGAVVRLYLAAPRVYTVMATGPSLAGAAGDMKRFFDSFKIGPPAEAKTAPTPAEKAAPAAAETPAEPPANTQAATPPPLGWRDYVSKDGRYSVLLPGTPKVTQTVRGAGPLFGPVHNAVVEGQKTFGVRFMDGAPQFKALPPDQQYKMVKDLANPMVVAKKVKSEKAITLAKYAGHEVELEGSNLGSGPVDGVFRFYFVDGRVYLVFAIGPTSSVTATSPDVQRVFDSFKLTTKAKSAPPSGTP
jgi:hypothetical protein